MESRGEVAKVLFGFFDGSIWYMGKWITWEMYKDLRGIKDGGYVGDAINGHYQENHFKYADEFTKQLNNALAPIISKAREEGALVMRELAAAWIDEEMKAAGVETHGSLGERMIHSLSPASAAKDGEGLEEGKCVWVYDDNTSSWDASCVGKQWFFRENKYKFCPSCGKTIWEWKREQL